jgi:Pyruvate/2-oxoglutarate dehydrogenase complex, dihydrolipoamide dehydrogenase (E3) component, and related enzymes
MTDSPSVKELSAQVAVLGAGPGGYTAAFRAADLGLRVVLIERYPTLGGVCLNVGCIPSKALLHTAAIIEETKTMGAMGVTFAPPEIDLDTMRAGKDKVVKKLTTGLSGMAKQRGVEVVQGSGRFEAPNRIGVDSREGKVTVSSTTASSPPAPRPSASRASPTMIRGSWTPPTPCKSTPSPSACWWWAAVSSAWKWPASTRPWAVRSWSSGPTDAGVTGLCSCIQT